MQAVSGHKKGTFASQRCLSRIICIVWKFSLPCDLFLKRESQAHQTGHWHGINKGIPICPGNRAQDKREVSKVRSNIPLASRSAASAVCYKSSCEPQHAQTNMRKQQCTFERPSAHTKPYSRQKPNDQADKVKQVKTFRGIVPQSSHGPFTAPQTSVFLRCGFDVPDFTHPYYGHEATKQQPYKFP